MSTFAKLLQVEHAEFMAKQARQNRIRREDRSMLREEEFHHQDAPQYAKEYYGEVYHQTTRHDKDWGDY